MTRDRRGESSVGLPADRVERRAFLKAAGAAAASGAVWPAGLLAARAVHAPPSAALLRQVAPVPLGNGEPPALSFQPYPGGTGALME
ncbi:MAG TPA: hypothetical protein VMM35_11960, partial [Longimicrobiales bacterium]|nr:hypothetical protein [Longimicrobiales bacterium]